MRRYTNSKLEKAVRYYEKFPDADPQVVAREVGAGEGTAVEARRIVHLRPRMTIEELAAEMRERFDALESLIRSSE